jgi:hypothetical protein
MISEASVILIEWANFIIATKYVLGKLDSAYVPPANGKKTGKETLAERWILHKL